MQVVNDFQTVCPRAEVVVVDNASTDLTGVRAREAGVRVIHEPRRGKGYAVRTAFLQLDAEVFVLVDGDATYSAASLPKMLELCGQGNDVVLAARRVEGDGADAFRSGHRIGNWALTHVSSALLNFHGSDSLTGYRVMSRRFVKTFVNNSKGFELETDLNSHAHRLGLFPVEVESTYGSRRDGSESKLRTFRDGFRLLFRNFVLFRDTKPLVFFVVLGLPWLFFAIGLGIYITLSFIETGTVSSFPRLIVGVGASLVFMVLWLAGLISESTANARVEAVRLAFLSMPRTPRCI